jgi:hypothetical protein
MVDLDRIRDVARNCGLDEAARICETVGREQALNSVYYQYLADRIRRAKVVL